MRREYPRPDFVRKDWMNLNGPWRFYYGNKEGKIEVPYVCQSRLSGISERIDTDYVRYEREFELPEKWRGRRIRLNFGAVDYECKVYINNTFVGSHVGGQTAFSFDISEYLNWAKEKITVEVYDPLSDETIARGKQFWEKESRFIWYTPSTGIWQTVWIEPVSETSFQWIHFTPDIDEGTVKIEYQLEHTAKLPVIVEIEIAFKENKIFSGTIECDMFRNAIEVDIFRKKAMDGAFHFTGNYWSPESPNLYDVEMKIREKAADCVQDTVNTYFGMRKIHIVNGRVYLNNQPYIQKLVLDQGYWKESLITAPDEEAYKNDILKCKEMGFNGCRKHEKVEDPVYLYWADKLGFLVWGSMASFWSYTPQAAETFTKEWMDAIERDYNHPCIVVWDMLNESWGVTQIYENKQQQAFASSLYYMAKAYDQTRLVISNDGWEMCQTDICAVHSYMHGERGDTTQHHRFEEALQDVKKLSLIVEKQLFADGMQYEGQPVILTECGGIAIRSEGQEKITREDAIGNNSDEWGYTSTKKDEFIREYERIIDAVYHSELMDGFCYTQLADIEQEKNGLLTDMHEYKFDAAQIRRINMRK